MLVQGDPDVPENVALAVSALLGDDALREACAVNGQKHAVEHSLIYQQLLGWLDAHAELSAEASEEASQRCADVEDALLDASATA